MGAALGAMVGWMTYGKRKFEAKDAVMRRLIPPLHEAMKALLPLVDADTRAFDAYLAAVGDAEGHGREAGRATTRMQAGLQGRGRGAARGDARGRPLLGGDGRDGARRQLRLPLRPRGGRQARSRPASGAPRATSLINLPGIEDEAFRRATGDEAERLAARAAAMRDAVLATLATRTG